jgi:hypothetical protein
MRMGQEEKARQETMWKGWGKTKGKWENEARLVIGDGRGIRKYKLKRNNLKVKGMAF